VGVGGGGWKYIQGDQKVSVHLMITIQSSGAQRLFDHPVYCAFGWSVKEVVNVTDLYLYNIWIQKRP
jgi:hypothetical protein